MSTLSYYKEPDEVPIYNYYKAHEDVIWLLRERTEINESQRAYLSTVLFDLQEFFSKEMNEVSYKNNLDDFMTVVNLERKKTVLEAIKKGLEMLREDLKYVEIKAQFPMIEDLLKAHNVAIRTNVLDQIMTLDREIKGIKNAVTIIYKKNEVKDVKLNWQQLLVSASRMWGQRIDAKVVTLAEWVEILKMLEKESRHHGRN